MSVGVFVSVYPHAAAIVPARNRSSYGEQELWPPGSEASRVGCQWGGCLTCVAPLGQLASLLGGCGMFGMYVWSGVYYIKV